MIVGIDYSMTSPAICILPVGKDATYKDATIHYLTGVKRAASFENENLKGYAYPAHTSVQDRFGKISQWAISVIRQAGPGPLIFLEGYAYGSVGKVFEIAENTGLLKHKLYLLGITYTDVPPLQLKKFATNNGRAKKPDMAAAFTAQTGADINKELGLASANPSSDIIDAYFLARWGATR